MAMNQSEYVFPPMLKSDGAMPYSVSPDILLQYVKANCKTVKAIESFCKNLKDILITIPSSELWRARSGKHFMRLPL
jgi:hypothetical protein